MPVSAIDTTYVTAKPPEAKKGLDMTTFLALLTTQLAHQNPLEPMDDSAFYGQLAQLGQVQGTDTMIKNLNVIQATSLIGKTVTAVRPLESGTSVSGDSTVVGTVRGMSVRNGQYYLNVQQADGGIVEVNFDGVRAVAQ